MTSRRLVELLLHTSEAAERAVTSWGVEEVLKVLDRHCVLQWLDLLEGEWWPSFDGHQGIVLGARLSVFRTASSTRPSTCRGWFVVFQLMAKDVESTQGAFLSVYSVAPLTILRSWPQRAGFVQAASS